jgi:NADH-quinone oxidoreductase subunit J
MSAILLLSYLFSCFAIVSSCCVIFSKNPVYSVLFLILAFLNVSSLLFLLQLEFLPVVFLMVYVGAVAVLLLFVIMMLNIKLADLKSRDVHYVPVAIMFFLLFSFELILLVRTDFTPFIFASSNHWSFLYDYTVSGLCFTDTVPTSSLKDFNMRSIGLLLFTDYCTHFIISGYILLFAMLGAITLTLYKKFMSKTQSINSQVLRNFNTAIVNYK